MRTHHPIRLTQIILVVCTLQLLPWKARGETWKSPELNCEISLPSGGGWSSVPPPVAILKVAVRNQTEAKTISLYVVDAPPSSQTLSGFLPGFKKSWFQEGVSTDRSEEAATIDGRSARRLKDTVMIQGTKMHRVNTVVIDNGKVYQVAAMSRSGNPLDDPEIARALNSFHFLSEGSSLPTNAGAPDSATRLPRLIGSITFYVLMAIVAIAVVIKIAARQKPKS